MTTTSVFERARKYVAAIPVSVSGRSGHARTFSAACKLVEFGLTRAHAWALIGEYNARCLPPWSERELRHKLDDAFRLTRPHDRFQKSGCYLPSYTIGKPPAPIDPVVTVENFLRGFRADEADVWESSPIKPPDDFRKDALAVLALLFERDELINFVTEYTVTTDKAGNTKANPQGQGETVSRSNLLRRWSKDGMPSSDAGGWLRLNPLDGQGVADANVKTYRYALLESDILPIELQLSLLTKLLLPISLILSSGGKSLHAWVKVDADNLEDYRRTTTQMLDLLSKFGIDTNNKNPSRLSRLPGVVRRIGEQGDGRQRIIYLNDSPVQSAIL